MAYAKPLTKTQVRKAMAAKGIEGEVRGAGLHWEVVLADDATADRFRAEVADVGGYGTGWDGWVLRPGYTDRGDWNDRSSAHHY